MRLIDADTLYDKIEDIYKSATPPDRLIWRTFLDMIADASTVDAVPVVRCKDCEHATYAACLYGRLLPDHVWCRRHITMCSLDGFCHLGERKEENHD